MEIQTLTSYLKLLACDGLGVLNTRRLLDLCKNVNDVFEEDCLSKFSDEEISISTKRILLGFDRLDIVQKEIDFITASDIKCVGVLDPHYPMLLKECVDAPILLFYKGNLNLLNQICIDVVGTRKITNYGKEVTEKFINSVSNYKPCIVSGMAYGVDVFSYQMARKFNVSTVAVMGTSFKRWYPSAHKFFFNDLIDNGLVVSEYAGFNKLVPELFIRRNRVIAGLCKATVVIESAEAGGAMSTAYFACDYDRDVYAIPGKITDEFSMGCLKLIRENKAQVLYNFNDFIEDLNWNVANIETIVPNERSADFSSFSVNQQLILRCLENYDLHIDELALQTNLDMSVLNAELMILELDSIVKGLQGKIFRLLKKTY